MSVQVVISGTGLFTPDQSISNEELVASYNQYVEQYNQEHQREIEAGDIPALEPSSEAFIEKASGIKSRFVLNKEGILDTDRMCPSIPGRSDEELSVQAEMGVKAAQDAMQAAGCDNSDIDAVVVACSNMQRAYPAMSIEIQEALGIEGFAYDMSVACSSATFGLQAAVNMIQSGTADRVMMINPEICSAHLAWEDRDCHFIFGDVATAVIVERQGLRSIPSSWLIKGTHLQTRFSNNIRNNFGFLNRCDPDGSTDTRDRLFRQNGRKVFKEVVPAVVKHLKEHFERLDLSAEDFQRFWLHQANVNMNVLIAKKMLGREATPEEAPVILDRYANTSSAGCIIVFHHYQNDLKAGDHGVICSFGAGYSVGSVVVQKC